MSPFEDATERGSRKRMIVFDDATVSMEKQRLRALDRLPEHCRICCISGETDVTLIQEHHLGKSWFRRRRLHDRFTLGLYEPLHSKLSRRQQWRKKHALPNASEGEHLAYALHDIADLIELGVESNGGQSSDWHTIANLRRQAKALLSDSPDDYPALIWRTGFQVGYYARSLVESADCLRAFFAGPAPKVWWSDEFWTPVVRITVEPEEAAAIVEERA